MDQKMSAEEWHEQDAKALAKENQKVMEKVLSQLAEQEKEAREGGFRDQIVVNVLTSMLSANQLNARSVLTNVRLANQYADEILSQRKAD